MAELPDASRRLLEAVPDLDIEIIGHTDSAGRAAYNQTLSESRALAVAEHLERSGIDQSRIRIRARGEQSPTASNRTDGGRALNRRIEFKVRRRQPSD